MLRFNYDDLMDMSRDNHEEDMSQQVFTLMIID